MARFVKKYSGKLLHVDNMGFNLYTKSTDDGIFELRAKVGSDITRVLYFFMVGKRVILTNGFVKKTVKTPLAEIARAKRYRAEYLGRKDGQHE